MGVVEIQEREAVPQIVGKRKVRFSFLARAIVLVALAAIGVVMRSSLTQPIQQHSNKAAETTVTIVYPQKASITIPVLPGQTAAYTDAPIYAQTSGYLKKWYFDIGAKVKAGDVLAEIDTPEVDQELAQAQAQIKVAQAALNLRFRLGHPALSHAADFAVTRLCQRASGFCRSGKNRRRGRPYSG